MEKEIGNYKDILNVIISERECKDLTRFEVASQLGISPELYTHYENGRAILKINQMMGIFNVLGIKMIVVV